MNKKYFYLIVVTLSLMTILTSCKKDMDDEIFMVTFDIDGGSPTLESLPVIKGEKTTKPADPTKVNDLPGLYAGTPPELYTLDGWYNGETKWNFDSDIVIGDITLKAKWTLPTLMNVSAQNGNNNVEKSIAYVNANPATYTLLIDEDIDIKQQWLEGNNISLTLVGLGGERKIKLSEKGYLFLLNAWGGMVVELILGDNITLVGRSIGSNGNQDNNSAVVLVQGATLTMLDGSKITGNTIDNDYFGNAGAVLVHSGKFTMKGGIITDNKSIGTVKNYNVGGVYISEGAFFNMEGGSIFGNTGEFGDVAISGTITLSASAAIGTITQTYAWYVPPVVSIASGWTGNVGNLHLYRGESYMESVILSWEYQEVLRAATGYSLTVADVAKFPLGNFVSRAESNYTQPIDYTHELVFENGAGVLKKKY